MPRHILPTLLILVLAIAAHAQSPTDKAPPGGAESAGGGASLDQLIDQLDAPEYAHRESATTTLMQRDNLSDDRLARALRNADSPEQRHRLTDIAMHRFYHRMNPGGVPRDQGVGSIGIDLSERNTVHPDHHPGLEQTAILISGTKPGFPGYVHLRPGDLILAIDGEPFPEDLTWQDISERIKEYRAGQPITLDILRDGERRQVRFRLASYLRLSQVYNNRLPRGINPASYPPWRQHLRSMLGEESPAPAVRFEPARAEDESDPAPEEQDQTG